jgi:DNA-binding MarR family transcriptional regulator
MTETSPPQIGELVMRWQDAAQRYDEAVGAALGLGAADLRCLALLYRGPQGPTELARGVGLSPSAATALIDRLEARGFVRRRREDADRRRVTIEPTASALRAARRYYEPLAESGDQMLAHFTPIELEAVRRFLEGALEIQEAALDRLLAGGARRPRA